MAFQTTLHHPRRFRQLTVTRRGIRGSVERPNILLMPKNLLLYGPCKTSRSSLATVVLRIIECAVPICAGLVTPLPLNLSSAVPRRFTTAPPLGYQTTNSQAHRGTRSKDLRRSCPVGSVQLWSLSQDAHRFAVGHLLRGLAVTSSRSGIDYQHVQHDIPGQLTRPWTSQC